MTHVERTSRRRARAPHEPPPLPRPSRRSPRGLGCRRVGPENFHITACLSGACKRHSHSAPQDTGPGCSRAWKPGFHGGIEGAAPGWRRAGSVNRRLGSRTGDTGTARPMQKQKSSAKRGRTPGRCMEAQWPKRATHRAARARGRRRFPGRSLRQVDRHAQPAARLIQRSMLRREVAGPASARRGNLVSTAMPQAAPAWRRARAVNQHRCGRTETTAPLR